jgi:hypothetical protein
VPLVNSSADVGRGSAVVVFVDMISDVFVDMISDVVVDMISDLFVPVRQ